MRSGARVDSLQWLKGPVQVQSLFCRSELVSNMQQEHFCLYSWWTTVIRLRREGVLFRCSLWFCRTCDGQHPNSRYAGLAAYRFQATDSSLEFAHHAQLDPFCKVSDLSFWVALLGWHIGHDCEDGTLQGHCATCDLSASAQKMQVTSVTLQSQDIRVSRA